MMKVSIDQDLCIGCEACVATCPVEAIEMKNDKAVIDADTCVDCGACVSECSVEAITLE